MPISLPPLPFAKDALQPHMSAETFDYHHGKHHKAYVDKTNAAIEGTELAAAGLAEIVHAAKRKGDQLLFNNAAQAWNHDFFWQSLSPEGGALEDDGLKAMIDASFGGQQGFADAFKKEATGHFGSGWAWLVARGDGLAIVSTHDADTPLVHEGLVPLVTLDVWEHAYYVDYRNARLDFVDAYLKHMINWSFVAGNLAAARA